MNSRLLELALAKQRLTLHSAALRGEFAAAADGLRPALAAVDRLRQGVQWLRRHPPLLVAVLVAVLVARPRAVLRLVGRGWVAWQALRRWRPALHEAGNRSEDGWARWKSRQSRR